MVFLNILLHFNVVPNEDIECSSCDEDEKPTLNFFVPDPTIPTQSTHRKFEILLIWTSFARSGAVKNSTAWLLFAKTNRP